MKPNLAAAVELVAKWRGLQEKFSDYETTAGACYRKCADDLEAILAELGRGAGGGNHIDALKAAYRKHTLDDDSIGWNQLSDIICNAICNEIGDKAFQKWLSEVSK